MPDETAAERFDRIFAEQNPEAVAPIVDDALLGPEPVVAAVQETRAERLTRLDAEEAAAIRAEDEARAAEEEAKMFAPPDTTKPVRSDKERRLAREAADAEKADREAQAVDAEERNQGLLQRSAAPATDALSGVDARIAAQEAAALGRESDVGRLRQNQSTDGAN